MTRLAGAFLEGLISIALFCAASPALAQVVANPDSGTADFGLASEAVLNVAANDTVNGAAATLGSGGNALIAKYGTWPAGLGLNPANGMLSTGATLAVGVYQVQYQLCAQSAPQDCAVTTDTITVIQSIINPVADSGTADYGYASEAILNVAANDTVNGAPAVLGTGGNAVIQKYGTWPPGLGLNPTTGTVSTGATLAVGTYQIQYQLCDLNIPKNCNTTTDTVTVVNGVIVANNVSGTADNDIASQPIANVVATDLVDGAPATLGPGANGQIAKVQPWPAALGLNPTTGAVSTFISTPTGVYAAQYKLCDLNTPPVCGIGNITVNVISASILANPVSGSGQAGIASTPIPSVVASDTVNGAPAVLGAGGNAQLTTVGAWPKGINLYSASGAVTISKGVVEGTYDVQYELCDLNVPANCAAGPVEIDVTSSVVANADSGTAVAGVASTPIPNVAANDTVNGVKARLQTSPNASVSQFDAWPAGIALNTATGAVTVSNALAPATYEFWYTLCNLNASPTCSMALDTLTVEASIVAVQNAGSAVVGTAGVPIPSLIAHDVVNGAPATLGRSGNAKISMAGPAWPAGITLGLGNGAITTATTVPAGDYALQYQICDKLTPPDCATAPINVAITQPFVEQSISPYMTGDIEFDWARDGIYCPTCNFGVGNSQLNWTDRNNNLWVSGVNPATGAFTPISGEGPIGMPIDTTAFFWQDWGNGPEWAFSTPPGAPGGNPVSQLVYTRYAPGEPATWEYAGAAIATQTGPVTTGNNPAPYWQYAFLPGAYTPITNNTVLPLASQCPSDPVPYAVFENLDPTTQMFTEPVSIAAGTAPTLTPFGATANGIGERWVACTTWLTFQGNVVIGDNQLQQVFWYDRVSQTTQQLTFDPTTKQRALMFRAPEFGGNFTLMTLAADKEIQIYEQLNNASYPNGAPLMTLVNTIYPPDPGEPYIFDPKAFIHCTVQYPLCRTYVVMGLSAMANSQQTETEPNGLGVAAIDPNNPFFEVLVTAAVGTVPGTLTQRLDPKYFITSNYGPVVYYDALTTLTTTAPYNDLGIYLLSMQLGVPYGPCVGSSAQEGLNPTWATGCTAGAPP